MFIKHRIIFSGRCSPAEALLPGIPQIGDVISLCRLKQDTVLVNGVQFDSDNNTIYLTVERAPDLTRDFSASPPLTTKKSHGKKTLMMTVSFYEWEHHGTFYGNIQQSQLLFRTGQQVIRDGQTYSITRMYWKSHEPIVYPNLEKCAPPTPERAASQSGFYVSQQEVNKIFSAERSQAWVEPRSIPVTMQREVSASSLRPHTPPQPKLQKATKFKESLEIMLITLFDRQIKGKDVAAQYKKLFSSVVPDGLIRLRSLAASLVQLLDNLSETNIPIIAISQQFCSSTLQQKIAFLLSEGVFYQTNTVSRGYIPAFKKMTNSEVQHCHTLLSSLITFINLKLGIFSKNSLPLPRPAPYRAAFDPSDKENDYTVVVGTESELPGTVFDGCAFRPINGN